MSRAYYGRFLGDKERAEIKAAAQRAAKSGKYDSVLRFDGKHVRHPALCCPVEFFAEIKRNNETIQRTPENTVIAFTVPSKDFERVMWQV